MSRIQLITCGYRSKKSGVADYSKCIAESLTRSSEVHIWGTEKIIDNKIKYHNDLGGFSLLDLKKTDRELDKQPHPRTLFVQWVPHGYGYKSLNAWFCFWILKRAKLNHDRIFLMIHEPFLSFSKSSIKQNMAALIHRVMIAVLMSASQYIFISIPGWESKIRPYLLNRKIPIEWLPIPSTISKHEDMTRVQQIRNQYIEKGMVLIGHFGTYGKLIAPLLEQIICNLDSKMKNDWNMLLIGNHSHQFRECIEKKYPQLKGKIHSTGVLDEKEISYHIQACNLFVQPYPDGVSSRRTSVMALLAHGKAIITSKGALTEAIWQSSRAVCLVDLGQRDEIISMIKALSSNLMQVNQLAQNAINVYEKNFCISKCIARLEDIFR